MPRLPNLLVKKAAQILQHSTDCSLQSTALKKQMTNPFLKSFLHSNSDFSGIFSSSPLPSSEETHSFSFLNNLEPVPTNAALFALIVRK